MIPDLPTYVGRVLKLDSMSAHPSNTNLFGPRVHLELVVKETGKLNGEFTVRQFVGRENDVLRHERESTFTFDRS